ncbi:DUF2158 domain-containing protein [Stenotrophomonas sp. 24(2023)]|uniref:YodC family protein n=1 Tax=Stenotrophomonas sp. 24(2023) TaxID=3068324 RepID=UPI0027E0A80D|nr:DUF2158 domain-containing protein [Stenotrophomonas sp. 24(2023)]WMJ68073.1 DUF2158 domain-containing protein [Stenotrophomonas sp. 24(2023)]
MDLKAGDQVQLKSGGPVMTVSGFRGEQLWCEWFDAKGEHQSRGFLPIVLTLYTPPDLSDFSL